MFQTRIYPDSLKKHVNKCLQIRHHFRRIKFPPVIEPDVFHLYFISIAIVFRHTIDVGPRSISNNYRLL